MAVNYGELEVTTTLDGVVDGEIQEGAGEGTTNYNHLTHKPSINDVELIGNKTSADLGIATTLAELEDDEEHRTVTDTEKETWNNKSDFSGNYEDLNNKPFIPTELAELNEDNTHQTVTLAEKATWNAKADVSDIPDDLADLNEDSSHRTVTDAEKTDWNNKSTFSGSYTDLTNKPDIPDDLADLNEDTTHRLVTDAEKTAWNAKSDFSGSYTDLTNKPELKDLQDDSSHRTVTDAEKSAWDSKSDFSGSYNDLTDKPSIPDELADLDDVAISNPTNGQVLKYNSSTQKFENANESGETVQNAYKSIKVADTTITASGEDTFELVAGTNITLVPDTVNKKVTINSSGGGGTSTGDMLKSIYDTNNDGIVNAADEATTLTGLDATVTELNALDGVTSNVQEQLNAKADSSDVPTALSDLSDDSTHRLVTDTEKTTWNGKSDFSGSYNDLTDKPSIPDDLADLNDDSTHRLVTDTEKSTWNAKSDFSGSYTDLTNKPTIPDAQVQVDWNESDNSKVDYIKNKPTIPDAQIQSDWNQSDNTKKDYIKNKPTIPAAQVQADWNELDNSEVDYIKNKPTIPSALADLSDDSTHRLVTDTEKDTWDSKSDFSGDYNDLDNLPTLGTAAAKNSTALITSGSTDVAEAGAVRDAIDSAVSSSYHHAGTKTCAELVSSLLVRANEGNVYNMTDSGVTTADFIEGAGKSIEEGANVGIAKIAENTYKFDLLSGFVDTSTFIEKSATSGLVRNDGSIDESDYALESDIPDISGKANKSEMSVATSGDQTTIQLKSGTSATVINQHQDISGKVDKDGDKVLSDNNYTDTDKDKVATIGNKADKVTNATNGNLAGLNGSGNLTDSGWNGAKDTTSISGNPISISGLKANQLAKNPIITFEPIQDLHGQSKPYPGGGGKNKLLLTVDEIKSYNTSGTWNGNTFTYESDNSITFTILTDNANNVTGIRINGTCHGGHSFRIPASNLTNGTTYCFSGSPANGTTSTYRGGIWQANDKTYTEYGTGTSFTSNGGRVYYECYIYDGATVNNIIFTPMIEQGSSKTTFAPYENICPISGYDKIEVLSCGVNVWDEVWELGELNAQGQNASSTTKIRSKNYIPVVGGSTYYLKLSSASAQVFICFYDVNKAFISSNSPYQGTFTVPPMARYCRFNCPATYGTTYNNDMGINYPATQTSYVASNKTTDLSESLGQTVYGGSLDLRSGKFTVTKMFVDLSSLTWYRYGTTSIFHTAPTGQKIISSIICDSYNGVNSKIVNLQDKEISANAEGFSTGCKIAIRDDDYTDATTFAATLTGKYAVTELVTPTEIQLTPHEISLLKNYAYVSTNGTNIALDYHNGELASLGDVSQLGETVNELGDKVSVKFKTVTDTTSSVGNFDPAVSTDNVIIGVACLSHEYIGIPFRNTNGAWRCRFLDLTNIGYIKNTSITAKIYYI